MILCAATLIGEIFALTLTRIFLKSGQVEGIQTRKYFTNMYIFSNHIINIKHVYLLLCGAPHRCEVAHKLYFK